MSEQIVLTGIKPTGTPHLGNYVAALKPLIEMAKTNKTFVFIADLHALNIIHDPAQIKRHTYEIAAILVALGLNLDNAVLFRQSDIVQVSQLAMMLMNVTPKGLMNRAHSYKAAVDKNTAIGADVDAGVNMGLYTYPILMAADILLYNSDIVPVGADQKQHVEICRDIAARFNGMFALAIWDKARRVFAAGGNHAFADPGCRQTEVDPVWTVFRQLRTGQQQQRPRGFI